MAKCPFGLGHGKKTNWQHNFFIWVVIAPFGQGGTIPLLISDPFTIYSRYLLLKRSALGLLPWSNGRR